MNGKLKSVSRVEILNTYRIRLLLREKKGLSSDGWLQVLNNIETCQLDNIEIGRLGLSNGKIAIVFIADKNILGCLEFDMEQSGGIPDGM